MKQTQAIADLLEQAFFGEKASKTHTAWHGPSVKSVVSGITFTQAGTRRLAHAHNIWELVLHITQWDDICMRRLNGELVRITTNDPGDWPSLPSATPRAWQRSLQLLEEKQRSLIETVRALPDQELWQKVPGYDWSNYLMIQGTLHHDIYHAGQIMLLKKAG